MVQSHLLQLLCLIAMEPPNRVDDQSIRSEKVKVLEALKPLDEESIASSFVSAQYTDGGVDGVHKPGYINEEGAKLDILSTACLLYTSPSPRDRTRSRMPSSA